MNRVDPASTGTVWAPRRWLLLVDWQLQLGRLVIHQLEI